MIIHKYSDHHFGRDLTTGLQMRVICCNKLEGSIASIFSRITVKGADIHDSIVLANEPMGSGY